MGRHICFRGIYKTAKKLPKDKSLSKQLLTRKERFTSIKSKSSQKYYEIIVQILSPDLGIAERVWFLQPSKFEKQISHRKTPCQLPRQRNISNQKSFFFSQGRSNSSVIHWQSHADWRMQIRSENIRLVEKSRSSSNLCLQVRIMQASHI